MKMPKHGEKGFTLIELLIVVAILGVLAAVVIPNVGRFIGTGNEEAANTEMATVQAAVQAMMISESLSALPTTGLRDTLAERTNDMTTFPADDADLKLYGGTDGNLLASNTTAYYYWIDTDGTVHQESTAP